MNSHIRNGNFLFNQEKYVEALEEYDIASFNTPELRDYISYNRKLAQHRAHLQGKNLISKGVFLKNKITFGIISPPHTRFLAKQIHTHLESLRFTVDQFENTPNSTPYDFYFVLCPQIQNRLPPGEKRICFQLEQCVSERWFTPKYFDILESSLAVVDYSITNLRFMKSKGIKYPLTYLLPIGGKFSAKPQGPEIERDIDVLFYGDSLSCQRRRHMLDELGKHFSIRIINDIFDSEMESLIKRSKTVINIHYYEGALLETPRIYEALSHGAQVVSEDSSDIGEHNELLKVIRTFREGSIFDMIKTVKKSLEEPFPKQQIDRHLEASENLFKFMLDRILIAKDILPTSQIASVDTDIVDESKIICLSMPETTERRDDFLKSKPKNVHIFNGIRKTPGWIGCGLSYQALAHFAKRKNFQTLTVMEDDAELPVDFDFRYAQVTRFLNQYNKPWDLFSGLIASLKSDAEVVGVHEFEDVIFFELNRMTSTVFNIYNNTFFDKLVRWDPTNHDDQTNTIDKFIESSHSLRVITTIPFMVGHKEELYSALWNFKNSQYRDMIQTSQSLLEKKVGEFKKAVRVR